MPISPEEKAIIWRTLSAGQDTGDVQRMIQERCPRPQEEEERRPGSNSLLLQRLRQAREEKGTDQFDAGRTIPLSPELAELLAVHSFTRPLHIGTAEGKVSPTSAPLPPRWATDDGQSESAYLPPCSLTVPKTGHRIALPTEGELILGRFDANVGLSPDVDLTSDAPNRTTISRRHARVSVHGGRYVIEDLGSTNCTRVNGRPLQLGEKVHLQPGDRVSLGLCELTFDVVSPWLLDPSDLPHRYVLLVAFTGHRFGLPSVDELILGRLDPDSPHPPDVDLGKEGQVGKVVSARHARLFRQEHRHFVEDLGSAMGTKVNGMHVEMGNPVPLKVGDHLWLGGCVLGYDVEIVSE